MYRFLSTASFNSLLMKKKSFCLILVLLIICSLYGSNNSLHFEAFDLNDKLPTGSVYRIFKDSDGYIWFGTTEGLCRFDGYELKTFRSSSINQGVLKNNEIQCIAEDKNKNIWIGMQEGINIIDKRNFQIKTYDNPFTNKDRINSILSSHDGLIWIATANNGIIRVNPETLEYVRFSNDENSNILLKSNVIINLFEDRAGRIWFTSWKNGFGYISEDRKGVIYGPMVGENNNPYRVYQKKNGEFMVCTWGDGVYNLRLKNNHEIDLTPIQTVDEDKRSIINKITYSITQDDKWGYIWLISKNGLHILQERTDGKYNVLNRDNFISPVDPIYYFDIFKEKTGTLWLGSTSDGAYKLEFKSNNIQNFPLNELTNRALNKINVNKIYQSKSGQILLFIFKVGLVNYDLKTGKTSVISIDLANKFTNNFCVLLPNNGNELWITNEGENAINIYKKKSDNDFSYIGKLSLPSVNEHKENTITQLFQDSKGNIWIGSYNGIFLRTSKGKMIYISKLKSANSFSEDSNHNILVGSDNFGVCKFTRVKSKNDTNFKEEKLELKTRDNESLNIRSIKCTQDGKVYIGTKEGCIYVVNTNNTIIEISGMYGITEESIQDFCEDISGALWITTTKKIIKYNTKTHTSIYFTYADGINMTNLNHGALLLTKEGSLIIGGNNGICTLNTKGTMNNGNAIKNHVYITDIYVENKSVFTTQLDEMYDSNTNRLTAKYKDNNIRIDFSTLNNTSLTKIQYAYKLLGINNDWIYTGNDNRNVNYTNLSAGHYTFMVKSSDENGNWSDDITRMEIVILPPIYKTWWAYLLYTLLLGLIGFISLKILFDRVKLKSDLKISFIEKEKSEELNQIKLKYFTNISHELLTPLTIIMLQIESLQNKFKSETTTFETMKENVTRLKRLIKQILVFRKTESGNMKLCVVQNDVIAFVKSVCETNFKPLIIEKQIDFRIDIEYEHYMAYFDPDKLDKIIYNLMSNAFKFTSEHGSIAVKISFKPHKEVTLLRLSVADNGSGISDEDLPHIFKRFYISNSSDKSQSHGIGLSLTQELISLHKGTIQVKSQVNEGSVFTIEIPISKNAYTEEELTVEDQSIYNESFLNEINDNENSNKNMDDQKLCILIVEDNHELNSMIVKRFSESYTVYSAENGIEALNILKDKDINLIISDVMMPEMDGLTLCKVIKNDLNTSHISFLMLTAKNSTEDRIDCYNAGADAYISKPFEMAVLYSRVRNLIAKRKQKIERFQQNHDINISEMEYSSLDELFLKEAISVVEKNIEDEYFDLEKFAACMTTSKSTVYRKIKSLTDLSPVEFIRNIKLKHAIVMLENNIGNISEVAYAVGFVNPKSFSRIFKAEFGLTPSEYLKQKNTTI